jgi:hypothetical protein
VFRIAKMVSLFAIMARSASLRKFVARGSFDVMMEKIYLFMMYGLRGFIRALPFLFLSLVLIFISNKLYSINEVSIYTIMPISISKGIMLLALCSFVAAIIVWIYNWITDYRSDYLPNWIRRELY